MTRRNPYTFQPARKSPESFRPICWWRGPPRTKSQTFWNYLLSSHWAFSTDQNILLSEFRSTAAFRLRLGWQTKESRSSMPFTLWPYYRYPLWISVLTVICSAKFFKSDVILTEMTSSNTFSSNPSMRSITFSLWASTAMISSRRTCSALMGPVPCDNKFGLSYLIPK